MKQRSVALVLLALATLLTIYVVLIYMDDEDGESPDPEAPSTSGPSTSGPSTSGSSDVITADVPSADVPSAVVPSAVVPVTYAFAIPAGTKTVDPRVPNTLWFNRVDVQNISSQGECGSCAAVAIADLVADCYNLHFNTSGTKCSAQLLLDAAPNPFHYTQGSVADKCKGGFLSEMFETARVHGLHRIGNNSCTTDTYPNVNLADYRAGGYQEEFDNCSDPNCFFEDSRTFPGCSNVWITGHVVVNSGPFAEEKALDLFRNRGPIITGIDVTEYFDANTGFKYFAGNRDMILTPPTYDTRISETNLKRLNEERAVATGNNNDISAGHALTIVGYGTENDQDYWLMRNTWGNNWQQKGFVRIARGVNAFGIGKVWKFYGVEDVTTLKPPT